jgi:hypothetical protein
MGIPLAVGLALSCIIFSTINTQYLEDFARLNGNPYLRAPEKPASALACFNSIWDLLWVTRDYSLQMGNLAFPSWTLWVPSAIYLQSYTVYIFMVVLPYSRPTWHITGLLMFAFGSWWFNSWGWYSATGLFLADIAINPPLRTAFFRGWSNERGSVRMPYWALGMVFLGIGTGLKYMWTAALPQDFWNGEAHAHPARYLGGSSFGYSDGTQPYPRMDNWLVIVGLMMLVEYSEVAQKILGSKPFKLVGRRALSKFSAFDLLLVWFDSNTNWENRLLPRLHPPHVHRRHQNLPSLQPIGWSLLCFSQGSCFLRRLALLYPRWRNLPLGFR